MENITEKFQKAKYTFIEMKANIDANIVEEIWTNGYFYETTPYSYQRNGFKTGKIIDFTKIKSTNRKNCYGFDKNNRIIQIKRGIEIPNQFYYNFIFYQEAYLESYQFDNGGSLQNCSLYFYNKENILSNAKMEGRNGKRDEQYYYKDNVLEKIEVIQYDKDGTNPEPYNEFFIYSNKQLQKIIMQFPNGYEELVYKSPLVRICDAGLKE